MPAKARTPKKSPVKPRQLRLTDNDMETIAFLTSRWSGPVKPLNLTAVVREALRRAGAAESRTEPRNTKR